MNRMERQFYPCNSLSLSFGCWRQVASGIDRPSLAKMDRRRGSKHPTWRRRFIHHFPKIKKKPKSTLLVNCLQPNPMAAARALSRALKRFSGGEPKCLSDGRLASRLKSMKPLRPLLHSGRPAGRSKMRFRLLSRC